MSAKSRRGPNPWKKQQAIVRAARKATKIRWAIFSKEGGKWVIVNTFRSPQERDDYYDELVKLNPEAELRRVNL